MHAGRQDMIMGKPRIIENDKGMALVETSIVIMVLFMLVFGIIEMGLFLFDKHILTNASREGARAGIVAGLNRSGGTEAEYMVVSRSEASRYCAEHLVTFGVSGNFSATSALRDNDANGSPSFGDDLIVTLTYDYSFLFLSTFNIGPVKLNAVSTMKLE
jgi:Flp pilus assembly protein TadG